MSKVTAKLVKQKHQEWDSAWCVSVMQNCTLFGRRNGADYKQLVLFSVQILVHTSSSIQTHTSGFKLLHLNSQYSGSTPLNSDFMDIMFNGCLQLLLNHSRGTFESKLHLTQKMALYALHNLNLPEVYTLVKHHKIILSPSVQV